MKKIMKDRSKNKLSQATDVEGPSELNSDYSSKKEKEKEKEKEKTSLFSFLNTMKMKKQKQRNVSVISTGVNTGFETETETQIDTESDANTQDKRKSSFLGFDKFSKNTVRNTRTAQGISKVLGTGGAKAEKAGGAVVDRFAVDVGASSVKVLQMQRNTGHGTGWQIVGMGHSPVNRTIVADKTIVDSAALAEAIERAMRQAKIRTKQAIAAVPTAQVITKTITMPKGLSMIEQEDYVQTEAPNYVPFPLDEVQMDFEIIGDNNQDANLLDVQLVAVRKDVSLPRIEAVSGAGVSVNTLDVEQFAIERAVQFLARSMPHEGADTIDVLVDIGHEFTHMYVLKDGKSIYSKDQTFGMIGLSDEVSRRFGIAQEEAIAKIALAKKAPEALDNHKATTSETDELQSLSSGLSLDTAFGVKEDIPSVVDPVSGLPLEYFTDSLPQFRYEVANQINRLVQFFFAATSYNRVHRIWIAGGAGALMGISDEVQQLTGVKTYIANPLKMVAEGNAKATGEAWDYIESMGSTFLTAVGLAIRED